MARGKPRGWSAVRGRPAPLTVAVVRGPLSVVHRLGWGVADQAVSSLSNFALGIVAARFLIPEGFGAFSLAYITYAFALSATRGLATDPLLVRFSGAPADAWRTAVRASTATSALAGVVLGIICVLGALLLPPSVRGGLIALGFMLPGLLLQDSWRFAFFAAGRPVKALVNDLVWGLLLFASLAVLVVTERTSVITCVLAFGGTAALAAGFGFLQSGVMPAPRRARAWVVDNKALGGRYLVENISIAGARQVRYFALGGLAGLVAIGELRAAEILMGPFLVILMGASQVAVPEAAHILRSTPHRLNRFCLAFGSVLAAGATAWGLVILWLLPSGLGDLLLGDLWVPAGALLPPVIVGLVAAGFEIAAAAGVRALAAAPRSLNAQLVNACLYLVGGTAGAYLDGARGSAWGVAIAMGIGAFVWWHQLNRALADFHATRPHIETERIPT